MQMKQNIIMIMILISLFFFGLLIYDFSDELDSSITKSHWYTILDGELTRMNLANNQFSFIYTETKEKVSAYKICSSFRYNRNINVIRLNCNVKANKIHLSNINDNSIVMTINGKEIEFFNQQAEAWNADFRNNNNLTIEEFNDLISFDFNKYTEVNLSDIQAITRSSDARYLAFVNSSQTLKNALNLEALRNYANKSSIPVVVIIIDYLRNDDLKALRKLNKDIPANIKDFDMDSILIYQAGERKFVFVHEINVNNFSEAESYNNI